jgi:pyridoxine 5-phosphate synthase
VTQLSVNVNKIALLRNSRGGGVPDVLHAAQTAIAAGAHGITVHPRPDARHITYADVCTLKAAIKVELNIEGNPTLDFLDMVCDVKPAQCTLVPDEPGQLTSDHGYDLRKSGTTLLPIVKRLRDHKIRVSLFMDPLPGEMALAKQTGADRIELYTEGYAAAFARGDYKAALQRYVDSAAAARAAGLGINAGHDLNQKNLGAFLDAIPDVAEVSIGHALISEAIYDGLVPTVKAYAAICTRRRG